MKPKVIAMIPVRMGSTRVPKKNLRMLGGRPLVTWIIEAAIAAQCFDEIWLNSEDLVFKEIADHYGLKFYHRPADYATDTTSNDQFAWEFLINTHCDYMVQLLATSPFISSKTIKEFTQQLLWGTTHTLVSTKAIQIECLKYNGEPINFDFFEHTKPSQDLYPVFAYACALMGWQRNMFLHNYKQHQGAYHGSTSVCKKYHLLPQNETIDIDNEADFVLAEAIASTIGKPVPPPQYYIPGKGLEPEKYVSDDNTETDVNNILGKDGVQVNLLNNENQDVVNLFELVLKMGLPSWSYRVINVPNQVSATLISQNPGEGNRKHFHPNIAEFWFILHGKYRFEIGSRTIEAKTGDVLFADKGVWHQITAIGDEPATRFAISIDGAAHVYESEKA